MTSNGTQQDDFKKFYKAKLIAENAYLRELVSRFSPFDDIHITEIAQLKVEKDSLS